MKYPTTCTGYITLRIGNPHFSFKWENPTGGDFLYRGTSLTVQSKPYPSADYQL